MMQIERRAIDIALSHCLPFYAYRLPKTEDVVFGSQEDSGFTSDNGFKIVPFDIESSHKEKILYAQLSAADIINKFPEKGNRYLPEISTRGTGYDEYMRTVADCLSQLQKGALQKVVLSKVKIVGCRLESFGDFFCRLCSEYPDAFIFIFNSEETGAWIGASPEILGNYADSVFSTMALAGTRMAGDSTEWSKKDLDEQGYVVDYISDILHSAGVNYSISDKYTKKAGKVEHLCNDFTICCPYATAYDLINRLHPTPALAGLPVKDALDLIRKVECHDREYYGGYICAFSPRKLHCYVNLRSMKFNNDKCCLFVGGGIVKASVPEKEWLETEMKSETLISLLR